MCRSRTPSSLANPLLRPVAAQVGYAVERGADALRVRLYWRARTKMTEDYAVFVHLDNASGKTIAQKDNQPQQDAYPTSFWDVGETVPDEYILTLPKDAPPGDYQVVVGVYRSADGVRLPVNGDGDSIVLATVPIRR